MRYSRNGIIRYSVLLVLFFYCSVSIAKQTVSTVQQLIVPAQVPRSEIDFNQDWKFYLGNPQHAEDSQFKDQQWRSLSLPHDWSIEGEFSDNNPSGNAGGALPGGIGWYRKTFKLPAAKDKKVYIDFGGVYRNSEVWINGHLLGKRPNGYISFRYELTPFLNTGKKDNVIAVKVDNSRQPNSRWYSGSGIYRQVKLVITGPVALAHWGTVVTADHVSEHQATLTQVATINNPTGKSKKVEVELLLLDQLGKQIGITHLKTELKDSLTQINQQITLSDAHLWSPVRPYLYTLITRIYAGNKLLDEYHTTTGIRSFSFDAQKGFVLNGQMLKILGVCMHHDLGALGTATNNRAMQRQLEILKDMGCNAIRFSHNPPAAEMLSLCDKMGFLVMDEAFDMWKKKKNKYDYSLDFEQWHSKDLSDMVKRDRNHPSVILWSIGNEIREQFDSTGTRMTKELVDLVKSLDVTRPVTSALTETEITKNFIGKAGVLDVLGFNYKFEEYDRLPVNFKGQKFLASETTSALETRGVYQSSDTVKYWPASGKQKYVENGNADWTASAYDNTAAYWGTTHEKAWKAVKERDFIAGLFIWTGFDYLGEPVPYAYPARSSYFGIVDLAGFPKDVYYLYQSEWTEKPVLHLFPQWNWKMGETIDVWAYYNQADEVELFLNGRSIGLRKKEEDLHVSWKVKYEPGTLKAVSRKNGRKVLSAEIHTAGKPFKIVMEADRSLLKADGRDLSFITVKITDEQGNLVPDADQLITFSVKGQGQIAGTDNGYQASLESFKSHQRKAFKGKCLLIIKSEKAPGYVYIKAKSPGIADALIRINCQSYLR